MIHLETYIQIHSIIKFSKPINRSVSMWCPLEMGVFLKIKKISWHVMHSTKYQSPSIIWSLPIFFSKKQKRWMWNLVKTFYYLVVASFFFGRSGCLILWFIEDNRLDYGLMFKSEGPYFIQPSNSLDTSKPYEKTKLPLMKCAHYDGLELNLNYRTGSKI